MFEGIKKYIALTLAGVALIGGAITANKQAENHYFPHLPTTIVVENGEITRVNTINYSEVKNELFDVLHEQDIELNMIGKWEIYSEGRVFEIGERFSDDQLYETPFTEGRANELSYFRNNTEYTYDLEWGVAIFDPEMLIIRYGLTGYPEILQEISDRIATNMQSYLQRTLDSLSDEDFALFAIDPTTEEFKLLSPEQKEERIDIMNSVRLNGIEAEIWMDLWDSYRIHTNEGVKWWTRYEYDAVTEVNSGIAEGESVAYLTGEDYLTELSPSMPGWTDAAVKIGVTISVLGLAGAGIGLRKRPKRKNEGLYTDGEIIQHTKKVWAQDTDLTDPALYAQEQLKALENS